VLEEISRAARRDVRHENSNLLFGRMPKPQTCC
jgi:hypothetical protein